LRSQPAGTRRVDEFSKQPGRHGVKQVNLCWVWSSNNNKTIAEWEKYRKVREIPMETETWGLVLHYCHGIISELRHGTPYLHKHWRSDWSLVTEPSQTRIMNTLVSEGAVCKSTIRHKDVRMPEAQKRTNSCTNPPVSWYELLIPTEIVSEGTPSLHPYFVDPTGDPHQTCQQEPTGLSFLEGRGLRWVSPQRKVVRPPFFRKIWRHCTSAS
jgi:hypothetical protein